MPFGVNRIVLSLLLVSVVSLTGCSSEEGKPRKGTSKVTGTVTVDGKPVSLVRIELHDVKGADSASPTLPYAVTDDQGKFDISTYDIGDGAPEGEYKAVFTWRDIAIMNQGKDMPDKLKERYSTVAKSTTTVKVEKDKPTDMGTIALTTK